MLLSGLEACTGLESALVTRSPFIEYPIDSLRRTPVDSPEELMSKLEFVRHTRNWLREYRPHVVHVWEKTVAFSAALLKISGQCQSAIVDGTPRFARTIRGNILDCLAFRLVEMSASRVVGNSQASLEARGRVPSGKYVVIPNGLDLRRFPGIHGKRAPEGIPRVVMTASFTAPKDHLTLVRAAGRLLSKGHSFRVVFVGDGPERERVNEEMPPKYADSFEFTGQITDVDDVLRGMDIGVLLNAPGHAEGMSNAIMEYMAAGLPVICTDAGGNPELVGHGHDGFLVGYRDVEGVENCLSRLLDSARMRMQMGRASRAIAADAFSVDNMIQAYINLYFGILE